MSASSFPPLVQRYFELVNADRVDELLELFSPDAVLTVPMSKPMHGREAMRRFYSRVPEWLPEHWDEPVRCWRGDNTVVVEIEFRGKSAAGRPVTFRAVDVMDLAGDKIARLQVFYDSHDVLRQRGLTG